jgi:hypothetical protein
MHNQKNYNIYTFESTEDKQQRIKNIVASQLMSYSYNMLSYEFPKNKAEELILTFAKNYEVDDDKVEELLKNLEEYSTINENKVKISLDELREESSSLNTTNNKDDNINLTSSTFKMSSDINTEIEEDK